MKTATISIDSLIIILGILLLISAFFSAAETALMSINRYRLKHKAKTSKTAKHIATLLQRPDRLLGVILIGNNFANISAASIATLIGVNLLGEKFGIAQATGIASISLTLVVLIFAEIMPKTLAALKPEFVAYPSILPLKLCLWLLFPIVFLINLFSNSFLRLFGISINSKKEALSAEELKTIFHEGSGISLRHRNMLASILELEKITINDIMIPRTDIIGIDLNDDNNTILSQLQKNQHKYLPAFKGDLNKIEGMLATRDLTEMLSSKLSNRNLRNLLKKPYFVPEGTSLGHQLINFQHSKNRIAFVVDEYGDILGLVTLEDILEEIVGDFTTNITQEENRINTKEDGSIIVDGSINIRELNKITGSKLPTKGAKTISGLVIEFLETIPEPDTCVMINSQPMEIISIQDNMIKTLKILPKLDSKSS